MDDDGLVDADMMVSMLPEEIQSKADPILQACKNVSEYPTTCALHPV